MKKGSVILGEETIKMLPRIFLAGFVLFFIFLILGVYLARDVRTEELEHSLLIKRLFYDQNCFSFTDERSYPGIIDLNKFQEERLEKCAFKEKIGYRLDLKEMNGDSIKSVEVNKKITALLDFCDTQKKNFQCYQDRNFVLVEEQGERRNALLDIFVVIRDEA